MSSLALVAALLSCSGGKTTAPPPAGPSCSVSPTILNFGTVSVGSSATKTFQVSNVGGGTLAGSISVTGAAYSLVGASVYSLTAGQSQTFTVQFAPTIAGSASGSVSTGCTAVTCSGVGGAATSSVFPETLSFGRNRPDDRIALGIHNGGSVTLVGTVHSPCPAFAIFGDSSYSIAPGDVGYVQLSFQPSTGGPQHCLIQTGLPAHPTVLATGYGHLCDVSAQYLDLGDVWESVDRTFTVTNPDSFAMSGSVLGCGPFGIQPTSYSIAPGASQTFTMHFSAQGYASGSQTCAQSIGQATCTPVYATAVDERLAPGLTGCAAVTQSVIDFGTLAPGQVGNRTITVLCVADRVGGGSVRCGGSIIEQAPSLSFAGGAFSNLAIGDSMRVNATFSSADPGVHHCRVMVTTNDGATGRVASYFECRATVLPGSAFRLSRRAAYR